MRVYSLLKRAILFLILATLLGLSALAGMATPGSHTSAGANVGIGVAYADGCDGVRPPGDLDCPNQPTPTPTPTGN